MSSEQTIVLITGANQGIGYETAKNLLLSSTPNDGAKGGTYHVIIGSRDAERGVEAAAKLRWEVGGKGSVEAVQLDVTDDSSVDEAARVVGEKHGRVDVLINNAGIGSQTRQSGPGATREALRQTLATNVVGAVSVTEAFMPLLLEMAEKEVVKRLIFISSTTGSLTYASDPNHALHASGGAIDYRTSKAAVSMLVIQYDGLLRRRGVKVHGINPGLIGTQGFHGGRRVGASPEIGGERVACVVRGERDVNVGKIVQEMGVGGSTGGGVLPW